MRMLETVVKPVRPIILVTLVVCLAIVIAPWFSGGQEPIAMLLDVGALLMGSLLIWRQPEVRTLKLGPLVVTFGLFLGFALLSLLWSVNRYSSAVWITQWAIAGLAFRLAYVLAGEREGRSWAIRAYMLSAFVFCVGAAWIYLTTPYDRLTGTIYWPNPAAAYLMPAIMLAIDKVRVAGVNRDVYLWVAGAVGLLASFLLTDSRGATLVLLFVAILYCLVVVTNRAFWIRFVYIILLGFVASIGIVKLSTVTVQHSSKIAPGSRLAQIAEGQSESVTDRLYYVDSALDIWFAHPVVGTGAGTFGDVHPQYQKRVISASSDAHNLYVQTLAELGLVGAILLAGVVLWLLAGVLRGLVNDHSLVALALGGLALLMHFGLDIDASYPALLALAAVCLGLVWRPWSQTRMPVSWRFPAVAALLLVPTASLYLSQSWAAKALNTQTSGDYALAATQFDAAHRGIVFDPSYIDAEGIDYYTVATAGGADSTEAATLALDRAREAERLAPDDGQNYQLEGRVLALDGRLSASEVAFRHALRLDPYNHPQYALDLATVQLLDHDPQAAVATANSMLAKYPDPVVLNRQLDMTLRPTLGDLAALVGNIYLENGNTADARTAGLRALHYNPGNLRGRALMHQLQKRAAQT